VIEFHLDSRSGVAPYLQLIHQVRQALRLGLLHKGDQLPKVKDVAAGLAINPNTVADLAPVPRPGRHRSRGAGAVRDPAGGHASAASQPLRKHRLRRLPRRRLRAAGRCIP
jgi:DNA-binding transcriptional MocR family regulator